MKKNINKMNEEEEPFNFGNPITSCLGSPWCAACKGWHESHTSTQSEASSMQRNPEKKRSPENKKMNICSYWRLKEENVMEECEATMKKKKKDEEECRRS